MTTAVHDVREPLALADDSVDAVLAHMLLCMALSTTELHALLGEVDRSCGPRGRSSTPSGTPATTSTSTVASPSISSAATWSTP
ncbi:hypothetical protein [Streptomyces poriferorum]|uniref:hypothetical protein n=1 Tax=Streptomyces poriferorum TaxID=2798799 RepID=UPI001F44F6F7